MLLIKNMTVHGAEFMNGGLTVGLPAMTAFSGLCHHIARIYRDRTGSDAHLQRFGVLLHQNQINAYGQYKNRFTKTRTVWADYDQPSAGRESNFFTPPVTVTPTGNLTFSVFLDINLDATAIPFFEDQRKAKSIIPHRGLAGTVAEIGQVQICKNPRDDLQKMRKGWILRDETDRLKGDGDTMDRLFDALTGEDRKTLAPMQIGWRAVSPGADRKLSRQPGTPHYFSEPIIGLVAFAPKYEFAGSAFETALWSPTIDHEAGLFYCSK